MTPRTTKDGPFCWQSKEALRRIRDWFDESNNVASALATYLALSEIESNTGTAGAFIATQSDIAKRAGVGQRTVRTILAGLQACQLLRITPNFHNEKFRAPSTYELQQSVPIGNGCHTIGNNFLTCGNERLRRQLPGNTRKREEIVEEREKKAPVLKSKARSVEEVIEHAEFIGLSADDGSWFYEKCEGSGWTNNGRPIRDWQMTMSSWKRHGDIFPSQKRQQFPQKVVHSGLPQPLRMVEV